MKNKMYMTEDGKTVINIQMGEEGETVEKVKTEKEFYYVREGLVESIIADTITFGFVLGGFFLNAFYFGGKWYIYIFFMFMMFVLISAKSKAKRFKSIKELQDYLKDQK